MSERSFQEEKFERGKEKEAGEKKKKKKMKEKKKEKKNFFFSISFHLLSRISRRQKEARGVKKGAAKPPLRTRRNGEGGGRRK